jgi:hypothetical protein
MLKRSLMLAFLPLIVSALPAQAQTVENDTYKDQSGVQFVVPPNWSVVSRAPASDGAHTILLRDSVTNVIGNVWIKSRKVDPEAIPALMSRRLDSKLAQRNNFEGYKYRADSIQNTTIGGRPAVSAIADYTRGGKAMVEYLTWVDGEKSRVAFTARMPASELADFQGRFDAVIQSAVVP